MNVVAAPQRFAAADLKGRCIFLSASFPHPRRAPKYFETANPDEIVRATVALSRAVFRANGRLIFGGHPTISPLVMMVAEEYLAPAYTEEQVEQRRSTLRVLAYQSDVFKRDVSDSLARLLHLRLGTLIFTEAAPGETPDFSRGVLDPESVRGSLEIMRRKMLKTGPTAPAAAVFIGGMEGIRDEMTIFREEAPGRPVFCIGAPGGAAQELARAQIEERDADPEKVSGHELATAQEYPALMQRIVWNVSGQLEG